LAVAQAGDVARILEAETGVASDLIRVRVEGDDQSVPLDRPSRPGLFTSALRDALLGGEVDYVVHSFKDLPSEPCPGLVMAAIPIRANPLDVLVGPFAGLSAIPAGSTVGTSSPRRQAALSRLRSDLNVVAIRGNVDTRLRKVADGTLAAAVMAAAGLDRSGLLDPAWPVFDPSQMLPAPAQGALAIECRDGDPLADVLARLDHRRTRLAVKAERAVLTGVDAACTTAIGALATWDGDVLTLAAELSDHKAVQYARVVRQAEIPGADDEDDQSRESVASQAVTILGLLVAEELLAHEETVPAPVVAMPVSAATTPVPVVAVVSPAADEPGDPVLIRAYNGERTARRPVWFMRQAGRSLPEFRAAREGIPMLESCLNPDLAAELTCQPVRRHNVDAAIFFSDIMVPARLAGVEVEIVQGRGPVLAHPVRSASDVDALPELTPDDLAPIAEGVAAAVAQLGTTPLIGFAGAPFTVASYLVEGGPSRSFPHTKALMAEDEDSWHKLADWVADTAVAFLLAQIDAGVQAVQLFDSWVGALGANQYRRYAARHSASVFDQVAAVSSVPRIHFGTRTSHLLPDMLAAGATVMGVDSATRLDQAETMLGGHVPLQGNIDPDKLSGPWEDLTEHVRMVLATGQSAPGHVVNLGHGVPPETDADRLTRLVEFIHSIPDQQAVA